MKLEKRQKYAIRKLSVGVASVLAAQFYVGSVSDVPEVQAGEVTGTEVASKESLNPPVVDVKPLDIDLPKNKEQEGSLPTAENAVSTRTKKVVENTAQTNIGKTLPKEKEAEKSTEIKEKEIEKSSEKKEKEDKKSLETKEVQEAKDTLSNRLLESKAVSQETEKYLAGKDVSAEVRAKLTKNLENSKQEENKVQQLLTKDKATLE